jgi:hypothetical protein
MTAIQNAPQHEQLAAAKERFTKAVHEGITKLMRQCGYSRERATAALLRELGRGDVPLENDEVFDTMTFYGLGVDDASQALTVSRAVKRAMNERGLSAAEAIDDLSSKLNVTKLVSCELVDETIEESPLVTSRPSSPQQLRTAPTPTTSASDRGSIQQRKRKANAKTVHKNGKQKAIKSRKRPAPSSDDKFSQRERSDSVTEAVEAKAKKARLSPEDSPSPEADPIMVRSKRNVAHREPEDSQSNTV